MDTDKHESPGLLRALGPALAVAIVVGNTVGSGIYFKPPEIARSGLDVQQILAAWVFSGVLCLLGALCFAELGAMLPHAGGLYVYLRRAYGRLPAFLFGLNEFAVGRPMSVAALSVAGVSVLAGFAGRTAENPLTAAEVILWATVLIVPFTWINLIGVIWGGRVHGGSTLFKVGFLLGMAVLPFLLYLLGQPGLQWSNYATVLAEPPDVSTLPQRIAAVMLAMMWAYNGWHDVAPVAEEIRDPQRNIPWSLFVGVWILIGLYVGANLAYHGVLSMSEIAACRMANEVIPPAAPMLERLMAPFGKAWASLAVNSISVVILCSTLGALNSTLLLGPRIAFAMGRDGNSPRILAAVHPVWRTPYVAILAQGVLSAVLVASVTTAVAVVPSLKNTSPFDFLTDCVVYAASIFYAMCVAAVLVFRRTHPEWERPYRVWGYPWTPIVFLSGYAVFLVLAFLAKPIESTVSLGLIAVGVPLYFVWNRLRGGNETESAAP